MCERWLLFWSHHLVFGGLCGLFSVWVGALRTEAPLKGWNKESGVFQEVVCELSSWLVPRLAVCLLSTRPLSCLFLQCCWLSPGLLCPFKSYLPCVALISARWLMKRICLFVCLCSFQSFCNPAVPSCFLPAWICFSVMTSVFSSLSHPL